MKERRTMAISEVLVAYESEKNVLRLSHKLNYSTSYIQWIIRMYGKRESKTIKKSDVLKKFSVAQIKAMYRDGDGMSGRAVCRQVGCTFYTLNQILAEGNK